MLSPLSTTFIDKSVLPIFLIIFSLSLSTYALENPSLKLIQDSCIDCHDEDIQKGNLRLDNLASLKDDPKAMHTWLDIYDKVESGEMPPKKKAFSEEEKNEFLKVLGAELSAFDKQQKEAQGRVVLRRLSSSEYEYAMRDLLHLPELKVKQFLPADATYHGIENVADKQQIAYNQIAQYLEAAETSLQAAVNMRPKPRFNPKRVPGSKLSAARKFFPNACKLIDDKLVLIKQPELSQGPWSLFYSPAEPGYYKIRLNAHSAQLKTEAFKTAGKTAPSSNLLPGKTKQTVSIGIALGRYLHSFDLSANAEVQECTVWLNGRERLSINCNDLPLRNSKFKTRKKPEIWDGVAIDWLEIEGPTVSDWPPKSHKALFGNLQVKKWTAASGFKKPRSIAVGTGEKRALRATKGGPYFVQSDTPEADSKRLLTNFMTKAYRRPVTAEEVTFIQKRVLEALEDKICFQDAMLIAYKAILTSPDFLYIKEKTGKLTSLELATRLSLYLWRSIPDDRLMTLAKKNKLQDTKVLLSVSKHMLNDPKADRFIDNFTNQWLDLESIYATTPDKTLYPEYHEKNHLIESFVMETKAFVREMVKSNLPIKNIVDSDFTFLNESLALHYDVPGVKGSELRKVTLPENSVRGGIITHGSMMKISANGFTTSPIKRGIWLLERVLGTPPPPPPPGAGSVEPDIRGATTIKEQLAKHREVKSCASCHKMIDPPGFALEAFDVMGGYREHYRSLRNGEKKTKTQDKIIYNYRIAKPVDATGEFEGEQFTDINSFKAILIKNDRQIARNILERLITQATGAIPTYSDRQEINKILDKTKSAEYPLQFLIGRVLITSMFLEK
ncbi:MAG: DUF1592 domain-containing protein [Lentisphaerales bacterium]|nr:DUF1592 domain-containing protein [Lentisphaerales bacterium]